MSTTTNITITAAEKEWIPGATAIEELFEVNTDYSVGEFDTLDEVPDDLPVKTVTSEGSWTSSFRYERKWSTDGLSDFAKALSASWPGTYVEVDEEWDSHDADEAGHTREVYTAGRIHKKFETQLVEVELKLNERGEVVV